MPQRLPQSALSLTSPFAQIFMACVLGFACMILLWRSEKSAVEASRSLGDAAAQTVSIDQPVIEPILDGRLIHTQGKAQTVLPVQDTELDLVFENALVVERTVEMFQWIEQANGASYKYATAWLPTWQDPSRFRVPTTHANPKMQIATEKFLAADATLGSFALPEEALATLSPQEKIVPQTTPRGWIRHEGKFFLGLNPLKPTVGDLRVSYKRLSAPTKLTLLARQTSSSVTTYEMRNGAEILMIRQGYHSLARMFDETNPFYSLSLWLWRVAAAIIFSAVFYVLILQSSALFLTKQQASKLQRASHIRMSIAGGLAITITLTAAAWLLQLPFEAASALFVCGAAFIIALRYKQQLLGQEGFIAQNGVAEAN